MNYWITIGEREYRIKFQNGQAFINDEAEPAAKLISLNKNGLHLLRREQRDVEVHLQSQQPGQVEVLIGAQRIVARVETPQQRARRGADTTQAGTLTAPMPGLVVGLHIREGENVECGQVLAVIESMKMQMQIRAPIAGHVAKVNVQSGSLVEKGAVLMQISE